VSDKKKSKLLQGCLVGCAIATFLGVVLIGSCGVWVWDMRSGFDEAIEARAELEERFGDQAEFQPLPDGSIPATSMEKFLAVRSELEPLCRRFEETFGAFDRMDQSEDEDLEPSAGDIFTLLKGAMGLAPLLGDYFAARNDALLRAELGLGEYTYIHVMAYDSWLELSGVDGPTVRVEDRNDDSGDRIHEAMISMLSAQRTQLADDDGSVAALDAEITALQEDAARVPWQDGLPAVLEATLESFRQRLESSYCAASADFDLSRNRSRGFTIQAD
jgi:hypothetical protein